MRVVVDELRALVEERGVVFVGFDDEIDWRGLRAEGRRAPNRADTPKFSGTPPTRNPGARPQASSIHASIAVVVVLPCVPATANTRRVASTFSPIHCGPEMYGRRASSMYSIAALPRDIALPTMTRSGARIGAPDARRDNPASARCRALRAGRSSADRCSGRNLRPSWPSSRASAATPPMKVPQMPRMCSFIAVNSARRVAGQRRSAPSPRRSTAAQ